MSEEEDKLWWDRYYALKDLIVEIGQAHVSREYELNYLAERLMETSVGKELADEKIQKSKDEFETRDV